MKLQELATPKTAQTIAQVFESYFGQSIKLDQLNASQAAHMLKRVRGILGEHRSTSARHSSEQNPNYLKLVMMEQALSTKLKEQGLPVSSGSAKPATAPAGAKPAVDPRLKAAQDKIKKGMTLTPEEQKMVNDSAAATTESRLRRAYRMLKESEVQQAQVVLAAQDMVDTMQGMLEDVSELQFKELPALVDSIKNQVGIDQATQFNTDAGAALTALMQSLQQAKQQLDTALGVVTGQTAPAADIPGLAADAGAEMGADAGAELGGDVEDDLDALGAEMGADIDDEEPAPKAGLGRARR